MIWLFLALALYPPSMDVSGAPGETVELNILAAGTQDVMFTTSAPLRLEEEQSIQGSTHLTLSARIAPHTKTDNYTAYLYAYPAGEDSVLVATAIPVRVAVHQAPATSRVIPTHRSQPVLWAALAGILSAGALFILHRIKSALSS